MTYPHISTDELDRSLSLLCDGIGERLAAGPGKREHRHGDDLRHERVDARAARNRVAYQVTDERRNADDIRLRKSRKRHRQRIQH